MPFARPSLSALIDRVKGDLRGRLEIDGPLLRRAMADALGTVWAGAVHTLYGALDWLAKQFFADTADAAQLLQKAALYGITPVPATFATGNVTATGTNGTVIPTNTILRLDAVTSYRVTVGQTIASGTALLPVIAVLAGAAANIPAGTTLTFESPIAGVNATATVATGDIADGVDQEGTEEVRARLLLRLRQPPEGGADQDWIAWALQVPGVTRAWVYRNENGLGTVVVRFVLDGAVSIFPDAGTLAAAQTIFNANRPTTATPTAVAPTALAVLFTIHVVPDTTDTRAAIAAELADLFTRDAAPGDGAGRGTILLSHINNAVGNAAGVTDYVVSAPVASVVPTLGQMPTVGTITWV